MFQAQLRLYLYYCIYLVYKLFRFSRFCEIKNYSSLIFAIALFDRHLLVLICLESKLKCCTTSHCIFLGDVFVEEIHNNHSTSNIERIKYKRKKRRKVTKMCGIFGYANWKKQVSMEDILNTLLYGLQKVEYRGYDSAGIAVDDTSSLSEDGQPPATIRICSVGNINQLRLTVEEEKKNSHLDSSLMLSQHCGVAHTRWATHGGVNAMNCHPHQSMDGCFTIVHNGIMTNFMEKKEWLQKQGYEFYSNTDTEVIAMLAQHLYASLPPSASFTALLNQMVEHIQGAYAILIKSTHFPNEIIGFRNGSPLILGAKVLNRSTMEEISLEGISFDNEAIREHAGEVEVFFASDCNSFLERTRWAIYLSDGDVVHFHDGSVVCYPIKSSMMDGDGSTKRVFERLDTNVATLSKGVHPTFMMKEVVEQGESTLNTMRNRIDFAAQRVLLSEIEPVFVDKIIHSRRLFFISCGTSYHSCLAVRPLMEELVMPVNVENASDFLDRKPQIGPSDTCIFVSQSGETADALLAMKHCKAGNAFLIGITNVKGSSIDRLTHCSLQLQCGAEVGVASTKAYTSQVVLLTLFILCISESMDNERVQARRKEIIVGLSHLSQQMSETIATIMEPIQSIARHLLTAKSILILGRGYDYATALEAALKIKELSYVHTEGVNSGELKHGPLALVDETLNVICFCAHDKYFDKSMNALHQIKARGGRPIVITNTDSEDLKESTKDVLILPKTVDCLQPVLNAVPAQLLAYFMAVFKGNNVDCPRNLAKSVTVE